MSINHFSLEHLNDTLRRRRDHHHHRHHLESTPADNEIPHPLSVHPDNNPLSMQGAVVTLFEKALTLSDVGKLNRLVIPKQHAEKHFPLAGAGGDFSADSSASGGEKGLLLSFEDELGKVWRFRYSYWNSSQSYVFTKGWSRYVKEKQLDAGDVVLFQRHREDSSRVFITCRRRPRDSTPPFCADGTAVGLKHYLSPPSQPAEYPASGSSAGVTVRHSPGRSRTVRLFGVNLECHLEQPPISMASSSSFHHPPQFYPNMAFSEDTREMTDHRG